MGYETEDGERSLARPINVNTIDNLPENTYTITITHELLVPNGNKNEFDTLLYCRNFFIGEKISLEELSISEKVNERTREMAQRLIETCKKYGENINMEFILFKDHYGLVHIFESRGRHFVEDGSVFVEEDCCFPSLSDAKISLKNMCEGAQMINDNDLSDNVQHKEYKRNN